jgi:hypothetical protein
LDMQKNISHPWSEVTEMSVIAFSVPMRSSAGSLCSLNIPKRWHVEWSWASCPVAVTGSAAGGASGVSSVLPDGTAPFWLCSVCWVDQHVLVLLCPLSVCHSGHVFRCCSNPSQDPCNQSSLSWGFLNTWSKTQAPGGSVSCGQLKPIPNTVEHQGTPRASSAFQLLIIPWVTAMSFLGIALILPLRTKPQNIKFYFLKKIIFW